MQRRELGKTGILITELGYGCTAQFGKDFLGKPGISEDEALALLSTAIESGIRFFDTGFNYGYAEERLGRCLSALVGKDVRRSDLIIQTKGCETLSENGAYGPKDYSPEWIKKSIDISLSRLQLDYIDLYALHGASAKDLTDELLAFLQDYKKQGIIRAYGISGISDGLGYWLSKQKCFDYVMMTYNYAEARRNNLIKELHNSEIGILAGGSLNRSMNTIRHVPKNRNELWYLIRAVAHYRKDLKRSRHFDFVKDVKGMTPQQVSLAYILKNKGITAASFNTLNIDHLKDNVLATDMKLPEDVLRRIEQI